jgi:hypothetical protein
VQAVSQNMGGDSGQSVGLTLAGQRLQVVHAPEPEDHTPQTGPMGAIYNPAIIKATYPPPYPPPLYNEDAVWFNPSFGWMTDPSNIKEEPGLFGRILPLALGAVAGLATGGLLTGFGYAATSMTSVVGQAVAASATSQLVGSGKIDFGSLLTSAASAMVFAGARFVYNDIVKYDVTWGPGGDAVSKQLLSPPSEFANNIGVAVETIDPNSIWGEDGIVSRALNQVPGINAVAGLHDAFQVFLEKWGDGNIRNIRNIPGMIPAAVITYGRLMSDISRYIDVLNSGKIKQND